MKSLKVVQNHMNRRETGFLAVLRKICILHIYAYYAYFEFLTYPYTYMRRVITFILVSD